MGSTNRLTGVLRRVRPEPRTEPADGELLARYARAADAEAFGDLVRRYGGLVLGVARRQLADPHRADDVFQATFLALARSASRLGTRPTLANWLYTVALRQARKARGRDARREAMERAQPVPASADPLDEITGRELLRVVDEELARLPDRFRLPVLLCCVQGLSREEAAGRLGWSAGSVKGRLERGRRLLAERLAARGLAPTAVALAPLAAVIVPAELAARAAQLAADPWSKAVPPAVANLAVAPTRKLPALAALAGCVLAAGLAGWAVASAGKPPVNSPNPVPPSIPVVAANDPPADDDPLPAGATRRFGSTRFRHGPTIEHFAASADGKLGVADSGTRRYGSAKVYDLVTGKPLFTLAEEPGTFVESVAVSPDGKVLAVKYADAVRLHDAATGKETARIGYPTANTRTMSGCLEFSPDGKRIVTVGPSGKAVYVLDIPTGKLVHTLEHAHVVFAAAFSPDGKQLVAGGYDSEGNTYFARLWETAGGTELRRLNFGNGGIRSVAFSPDGKTVALAGDGGNPVAVRLIDAATGKETLTIPYPEASSVRSVAFSPDGSTLAASGGRTTRLFDTATGQEKTEIGRRAIGLRFSPDGSTIVGAVAGAIYRWEARNGRRLTPDGADSVIGQVEVPADGGRVVVRGEDGDAHVWDARTGERLRGISVSWQRGMAVGPDGKLLVWPRSDEKVQFKDPADPRSIYTGSRLHAFDLADGKPTGKFPGFEGDANDLFFADGGKTLVTVDFRDAKVRVWDVAAGKETRSFRAARDEEKSRPYLVWHSRLSPDGKVLAVAYQRFDKTTALFGPYAVRLFDVAAGKELHELHGHWYYVEALAFSPDGKFLMTGGEPLQEFAQQRLKVPADQVFVWNVETGKAAARLPAGASAGAFSPDGKTLAVAVTPGGVIQLWDVAKWEVRGELPGPQGRVTALAYSADGRLFSGGSDTTVLAWDPKAAKPPAKEP